MISDPRVVEIEEAALLFGWSRERLYNDFWESPRGLASVLFADDSIGLVGEDFIEIRGRGGSSPRRFYRQIGGPCVVP